MITFPPIKKLFRRELFTTALTDDVKDLSRTLGPFGFEYGYYAGKVPAAKSSHFFVFSYFTPEDVAETTIARKKLWQNANDEINLTDGEYKELEEVVQNGNANATGKISRYLYGSAKKIVSFLANRDWEDYCIMLIMDKSMFEAQIQDNTGKWVSFAEWWVQGLAEWGNRVVTLWCRCGKEKCMSSPYAATCVRFAAMTMYPVDTAVWRDAHSSLPNPNNTYDLRWKNFWYNETSKKFWIYSMVNYQAKHNRKRNTMFAATWAARKIEGKEKELTIADKEIWKRFEKGFLFVKDARYGIDEQILNFFIDENYIDDTGVKSNLVDRSLVVGLTHILWLFAHKLNVRPYKSVAIKDPEDSETVEPMPRFQKFDQNILLRIGDINAISLDIKNLDISGTEEIAETYFAESGCVVKAINNELTTLSGSAPTLDKLFTTVLNIQNTDRNVCGKTCSSFVNITKAMASLVPTPWHLWSFLFDIQVDPEKTTLFRYLKNSEWFFGLGDGWKVDWENQCSIVEKFFKGGKMDYDKYQYVHDTKNPHNKLPNNIVNRDHHPVGYYGNKDDNLSDSDDMDI